MDTGSNRTRGNGKMIELLVVSVKAFFSLMDICKVGFYMF